MDSKVSSNIRSIAILSIVPLIIILPTFLGAVGGWVVGLFMGNSILGALASMGITNISMWQLGALLGFVGGYFRDPFKK